MGCGGSSLSGSSKDDGSANNSSKGGGPSAAKNNKKNKAQQAGKSKGTGGSNTTNGNGNSGSGTNGSGNNGTSGGSNGTNNGGPKIITKDTKFYVLVLGGPGSGKASLCARMVEEYDIGYANMGALLRTEARKVEKLAKTMQEGKLVASDVALPLLKEQVHALHSASKNHVVIGGFPKTLDQVTSFDAKYTPDIIIYLECSSDKLEQRLLLRADGGERADDKSEAIMKRLEQFNSEYLRVVDHYAAKYPRQFKKIKAGALQKTEVFLEVASHLKEMFGMEARSALVHKKHDCSKLEYVFILGGPGSGKGTQCKQMVKEFGFTHVSTGDLLRNEVKSGTSIGREVDAIMREGKLVPLSLTLTLLENAFQASGCKHFLIDGFPRSIEQAHAFEEKFGKPSLVISLTCSTSTMEKRLMDRGKTSNRADDNPDTIRQRFETFQNESKPVIDYYKSIGKTCKVKEVSAEKDPQQVFKSIKETVNKLQAKR